MAKMRVSTSGSEATASDYTDNTPVVNSALVVTDPTLPPSWVSLSDLSLVEPEQAISVIRTPPAWWTGITGLTQVKLFDARYSGQAAGAIAALDDRVGGADAVQVAAPKNPILSESGFVADNGAQIAFRRNVPNLLQCNSLATGLAMPFSLFAVLRWNVIDNNVKNICGFSVGGGLQWYAAGAGVANTNVWIQDAALGVKTLQNVAPNIATTKTSFHALIVDGANSRLWDNGTVFAGNLAPVGAWAPTIGYLGAFDPVTNGLDGDLRAFSAVNGAANQAALEAQFCRMCGQVPARIVCEGDSLTSGVGGTAYPTQLGVLLNDYSWVENNGVGGATLADMIAQFAANILPRISATLRTTVQIWAGTNDVFFGASGATTIARLWELCDLCRRAGAQVTVLSMIPRSVFTATQNTARDEFNAAFEQHWANHADGAVYLHRVNGLSVYNPENWDADGIHLNTSGYSLVARASSQLSRILNAIL